MDLRLYWVHPKTTGFTSVWQIRTIHGKTAEMFKCLLAPKMKTCCTKKDLKILIFEDQNEKIPGVKNRMRMNERTKWGENRSANKQQTNSPHSAVVGKYPQVCPAGFMHMNITITLYFFRVMKSSALPLPTPSLLNVFLCTLADQADLRLLLFCSRQQCCLPPGSSKCHSASDVRALLCYHFNYVTLLHEVLFATGNIAER